MRVAVSGKFPTFDPVTNKQQSTMNATEKFNQFITVVNIAGKIREAKEGKFDEESAVEIATAYLLACERAGVHHHPEDNPTECFEGDVAQAMQKAHDAVWDIIGECHTSNRRYVMAWAVWGTLLGEGMGTGSGESTL